MIGYTKKENYVSSDVCYHGVETRTIYRIDAGTCKKVVTLFNNAGDTPEGKTPTYEVNDKKSETIRIYSCLEKIQRP